LGRDLKHKFVDKERGTAGILVLATM